MTDRLPVTPPDWCGVELDPRTQTARYLDGDGQVIEAANKPSKTKGTASVSGGGDGAKPAPQWQDDTTTDYDSD